MGRSYQVRVWKIEPRKNSKGKVTSYRLRWEVERKRYSRQFKTEALADSFRAELLTAARNGEAFDTETGLPESRSRADNDMPWFVFACEYVDMKWPDASPKYRKSLAEFLMTITVALLDSPKEIDGKALRKALRVAFNPRTRDEPHPPQVADALKFAARSTTRVSALADPEILRKLLQKLDLNIDGSRASNNTVRLRRVTLNSALEYAIERELLTTNPLKTLKTKKRKSSIQEIDPAAVVNPMQARMLLAAVGTLGKQGPPLVAFFALMYYAGLRPEEAANVKKGNLALPEEGWGDIHLEKARPEVAGEWTDSGEASAEGPLKHRDDNIGRSVPCPPALTEILHTHLTQFGTARDGRLFRGARDGGRVGSTTYGRVWAAARAKVFTPEVAAGPLAKRPYDLRHAAVSTWLKGAGAGEAPRVAKWAGHSLSVLLRVYAKCLDGGERAAREGVAKAFEVW
ncbi:integrase [Prauserella coralliicola]|nr:integrase [Prauserella coralliicola]